MDNKVQVEKDRSNGKLKELYESIKQYAMLNAWSWLGDTDIFAIKFSDADEIYFCCVLGNAGESFGISIYEGIEGIRSYFSILDGDYDFEEESIHNVDAVTINLEDRNEIENEDYELIRMSGVKFRGRKQWPEIRKYKPGFYPAILDYENTEVIEELTRIMKVVPGYVMYLRENMEKASLMQEGKCIVREYESEDKFKEYELDYDDYLTGDAAAVEIPLLYSETDIRRAIRKAKKSKDIWEVDIFNTITPVEEDGVGIFPAVMLFADVKSGMIAGYHMTHPYKMAEFQLYFLDTIKRNNILPSKILIKQNPKMHYLYDLLRQLDIEVVVVEKLKLIPEIKKGMFESMRSFSWY
jgi:hypothetical protein